MVDYYSTYQVLHLQSNPARVFVVVALVVGDYFAMCQVVGDRNLEAVDLIVMCQVLIDRNLAIFLARLHFASVDLVVVIEDMEQAMLKTPIGFVD